MYTNIPHDNGLDACSTALAISGHASPPIADITPLMNYVLIKNNFTVLLAGMWTWYGHTCMYGTLCYIFISNLEQRILTISSSSGPGMKKVSSFLLTT